VNATSAKPRDSKGQMQIDVARAEKPPRKLRKLLKNFSADPAPETVHELRTLTRKLEALLHALPSGTANARGGTNQRHLRKILKPVRRAAGRVRDMDVLIGNVSTLASRVQSEGIVRLVEHMSAIRAADAGRLLRCVKRRRKKASSALKRFLRDLEGLQTPGGTLTPTSSAPPQILAQKLEYWPTLSQGNLHEFRKIVKELHYMLQLVPSQSGDHMTSYARVKDTVGDWHDWLELKCIAESVLDPEIDAPILGEIGAALQQKLLVALNAANSLRRQGIEMSDAA
jgi:CHAD domain-containing protein